MNHTPYRFHLAPRWGDLDALNHVNNANYLRYLEEARIHWLSEQMPDWPEAGQVPVLASATVNYRQPIGYPVQLLIELFTTRIGTSSLTVGHRILDADNHTLHSDGEVTAVWIDRQSGRPAPLPDAIRQGAERIAAPG